MRTGGRWSVCWKVAWDDFSWWGRGWGDAHILTSKLLNKLCENSCINLCVLEQMWLVIPRGRVLVASSQPLCLQSIATANAIFRQNTLLSQGRWEPALLNRSSCEETSSVGPTPLLLAPGCLRAAGAPAVQCSEAEGRPADPSAVSWWALCTTVCSSAPFSPQAAKMDTSAPAVHQSRALLGTCIVRSLLWVQERSLEQRPSRVGICLNSGICLNAA